MHLTRAKQAIEWRTDTVARRVKQVTDPVAHFRRGRRYGQLLAKQQLPADSGPPGRLESYFDAHTEGPGRWKWRHYFPMYERHLGRFVGRAPVIVEIGIFSGGSLHMWLSYLGAGTQVHGVDIEEACTAHESDTVSVWIGDQANPLFWDRFLAEVPKIDIVIDDGGHEASQQIPTLEALLPHLSPGGVYVCEDILGDTHPFHAYIAGLSHNLHTMGPSDGHDGHVPTGFQQKVSSIHSYPFATVIETRDSQIDRLLAPKHGTQWEPFYGSAVGFPSAG
jgi:hypothetical protein